MHSLTLSVTRCWRSQSANTRFGDLPPNSKVTFFIVSADSLVTDFPPLVDPVKDIISISGCFDIATPTTSPVPWTKLNTPGSTPASSRISV